MTNERRVPALSDADLDTLELELRRVAGVVYVGFDNREDVLTVQVFATSTTDTALLRARINQICATHTRSQIIIEIEGPTRPSRVRLLDVRRSHHEDDAVEVHLAFGGMRTVGRDEATDPYAVANATVQALEKLGAEVAFEVSAAAVFDQEGDKGVVLVLSSSGAGPRYGVATADTVEQAAARATLHALNRYLATQPLAS